MTWTVYQSSLFLFAAASLPRAAESLLDADGDPAKQARLLARVEEVIELAGDVAFGGLAREQAWPMEADRGRNRTDSGDVLPVGTGAAVANGDAVAGQGAAPAGGGIPGGGEGESRFAAAAAAAGTGGTAAGSPPVERKGTVGASGTKNRPEVPREPVKAPDAANPPGKGRAADAKRKGIVGRTKNQLHLFGAA